MDVGPRSCDEWDDSRLIGAHVQWDCDNCRMMIGWDILAKAMTQLFVLDTVRAPLDVGFSPRALSLERA